MPDAHLRRNFINPNSSIVSDTMMDLLLNRSTCYIVEGRIEPASSLVRPPHNLSTHSWTFLWLMELSPYRTVTLRNFHFTHPPTAKVGSQAVDHLPTHSINGVDILIVTVLSLIKSQ